jgi:hypothetical protein
MLPGVGADVLSPAFHFPNHARVYVNSLAGEWATWHASVATLSVVLGERAVDDCEFGLLINVADYTANFSGCRMKANLKGVNFC